MSVLRVGGLASGMDIEAMVKELMTAQRMPLDKVKQDKQILEWKREYYREINKALFDFRDVVFNLKLESTFNTKSAKSSDESIVEVRTGANAISGVYEIAVQQLAKGVYKTSTSDIDNYTTGDTLEQQFASVTWDGDKTGQLVINGEAISFDAASDSIDDIVNNINKLKEQTGVTASYDSDLNRFFLSSTSTGAGAQIDFTGTDVNGLNLLGNDVLKLDTVTAIGQDAIFKLNGATFQEAANKFTINGVTYDLKGINDADGDGTPVTTITVSNDTEAVFEEIKVFIDAYNELMEKIYGKLHEERYREYHPLTEEQKTDMSDEQIELWEKKARSGLLRSDWTLNQLTNSMRMTMSGVVEGITSDYNVLIDLGITTKSWYENGQLNLNEDDLRMALNNDLEGVKKMFTNNSEINSERGFAFKLYDAVKKENISAGKINAEDIDFNSFSLPEAEE